MKLLTANTKWSSHTITCSGSSLMMRTSERFPLVNVTSVSYRMKAVAILSSALYWCVLYYGKSPYRRALITVSALYRNILNYVISMYRQVLIGVSALCRHRLKPVPTQYRHILISVYQFIIVVFWSYLLSVEALWSQLHVGSPSTLCSDHLLGVLVGLGLRVLATRYTKAVKYTRRPWPHHHARPPVRNGLWPPQQWARWCTVAQKMNLKRVGADSCENGQYGLCYLRADVHRFRMSCRIVSGNIL